MESQEKQNTPGGLREEIQLRECHILERLKLEMELDAAIRDGDFMRAREPLERLASYIYDSAREHPDIVRHPDVVRIRLAEGRIPCAVAVVGKRV